MGLIIFGANTLSWYFMLLVFCSGIFTSKIRLLIKICCCFCSFNSGFSASE